VWTLSHIRNKSQQHVKPRGCALNFADKQAVPAGLYGRKGGLFLFRAC